MTHIYLLLKSKQINFGASLGEEFPLEASSRSAWTIEKVSTFCPVTPPQAGDGSLAGLSWEPLLLIINHS